jgi:hypothetical protein
VQAVVIETASVDTAKATSNVLPLIVAALVIAWNVSYAKWERRKRDRAIEAARSVA